MFVRAVLGGIAGAILCGGLAFVMLSLVSIGSAPTAIESAMLVLSLVAVVAIGGLVLGVWLMLRRSGPVRAAAVAGYSAATFVAVAGIGGAIGYAVYLDADTIVREHVQVEFEVRLPASYKVPPREQIKVELRTDKNIMPGEIARDSPRREGDATLVRGTVDLYFLTPNRAIALAFPGEPELFIPLQLAANPYEPKTMTEWKRVAPPGRQHADRGYEIRYRVKRAGLR
jgi:hypothetical protein